MILDRFMITNRNDTMANGNVVKFGSDSDLVKLLD